MSSNNKTTLRTFIYSTVEDHMAAQALLNMRNTVLVNTPIAWRRTMRSAAIVARNKIHAQARA